MKLNLKLSEPTVKKLKYAALIALLGALVYAVPLLWELGLVGAIGGAIWIFAWPKQGKVPSDPSVGQ